MQVVHETPIGHVVFFLLLLHSQLRKCVNDDTKHDVQQNLQETTADVNGPAARCTLPVDDNTVSRTMLNLQSPKLVSALSQAGSLVVWKLTCDHTPTVWPSLGLLRRRWRSCICDTGNVSPHKDPLSRLPTPHPPTPPSFLKPWALKNTRECSVRHHQASSHHTTRVHLIEIGPEAREQRATGATDTHVVRVTFQAIFRYKIASQPRESLMILQRTVNRSSGMHSCTGHVRRWRSSTQSQGIAGAALA